MGDYLNGRIAIESVNGGYGLDLDFMDFIYFLHEAFSNGWKPVGRDPDNEMVDEQLGNFPVITDQDALSLVDALQISQEKLAQRLLQETGETNLSRASNKNFGLSLWIFQFEDLIDLLSFGQCYLRAVHEELG